MRFLPGSPVRVPGTMAVSGSAILRVQQSFKNKMILQNCLPELSLVFWTLRLGTGFV